MNTIAAVKSINWKKRREERRGIAVDIFCARAGDIVPKKEANQKFFRKNPMCLDQCLSACV